MVATQLRVAAALRNGTPSGRCWAQSTGRSPISSPLLMPMSFSSSSKAWHRPHRTRFVRSNETNVSNIRKMKNIKTTKPVAANPSTGSMSSSPSVLAASSTTIWTIPTVLTLLRVVAIPLLVTAWFSGQWAACFALFVGASVTDFFDGYLARKWECSTPFGAFLDPVADKLMVATILILIGTVPVPAGWFAGNTWLLPTVACVIIAREITMSALREWAAALGPEAHAAAAVNTLGKYKTSSQMASLVLLLGAKTAWIVERGYEATCTDAGMALLGVATFLTVQSVLGYFAGLWRFFV